MEKHKPKVIFLDAVGTLFGVQGTVGEVYSKIAHEFGVTTDPTALDTAFTTAFKAAPPLAFPGAEVVEIPNLEYQWWLDVSQKTFETVGARENFNHFEEFFDRLYSYFATPHPWFVYKDIVPVLETWKANKIALGIISNFDSRLHMVLEGLELAKYFQSITVSSFVGAAKPERAIFTAALNKHQCEPHQAWHIGDSINEDFDGAKSAGLKAYFLERPG
ncbi:MAG: HAD-IA family hydrolase [Jaaginema sp. PMC 1079.18]|nr:HAD-IA family hydrolase [Jaaginema sp. PMC 1080.18]MEC4849487.1 HAD-IA family hydrolase [Jaaginema sp. PMC 1079.18]MEC4866010.1 HAD-IA family hydrolase [Jaaginema sp. PMC 1078.18]